MPKSFWEPPSSPFDPLTLTHVLKIFLVFLFGTTLQLFLMYFALKIAFPDSLAPFGL